MIPSDYDSMIAKVIAWGSDRDEALARLRRALEEMRVVVRGGATNRAFLLDLLDRPEVVDGHRRHRAGSTASPPRAASSPTAAPTWRSSPRRSTPTRPRRPWSVARFYASARRGRPKASHEIVRTVELRHRGESYRLTVARTGPGRYRVTVPEGILDVDVDRRGRFESRLLVNGRTHRVISVAHPPDHLIEVDGVAHRVSRDEGGLVRAPAPALVVSVTVAAGDAVTAGAPVVVLESMKMETAVDRPVRRGGGRGPGRRERPGRRRSAAAADGGADRGGRERVGAAARRLRHPRHGVGRRSPAARVGDPRRDPQPAPGLRRQRGRGPPAGRRAGCAARGPPARRPGAPSGRDRRAGRLRGPRRALPGPAADAGERARRGDGPQPARALPPLPALPGRRARGRARSRCGARWSGRSGTTAWRASTPARPSPRPPTACSSPQERVPSQLPAVAGLLDGRLRDADTLPAPLRKELRETLDRLVVATQLRHPAIGELARSVRFACFDRPLIAAARERAYRRVRDQLDAPGREPRRPRPRASSSTRWSPPRSRSCRSSGERAATRHRRPRADARGADPPLLQDPRPARPAAAHRGRAAARHRHLRAAPAGTCAWSPPSGGSTTSPGSSRPSGGSCGTSRTPRAAWPTSTSLGDEAPDPDEMAERDRARHRAAALPADGAAPRRVGGLRRRGDQRVHLPPGRRASARGAGGPRAAPDDLAAAALLAARATSR